jgi:hypothetical protein
MRCKYHSNAKGMVLIIVLILVGIITIVGLGFIVRGDTELTFGQNMEMKADMDYLADAGLEHGRGLIMCPHDLPGDPNIYPSIYLAQQLSTGSDYYDVNVTKISELDFQIKSDAYRMQSGSKFATNSLTAKLRLDPAVAFWTAATGSRFRSDVAVSGDVYCNGSLDNDGVINGDCFLDAFTGTLATGKLNAKAALTLVRPTITCSLLSSNFSKQAISSSSLNNTTLSGTYAVYLRKGGLELQKNVTINGCLAVDGNLTVTGTSNVITAKKNVPAICVTGNLILKEGAALTANGLVFVDGRVEVPVLNQSTTITGSLVTDDGIRYILPDYSDSGYDGVVNGDCAGVEGRLEGAINFDGNGDFIDIGNRTNLNITTQITVSAFIKTNSTSPTYQGIITKGNTSWRLQKSGSTNYVEFVLSGVTNGSIVSNKNINDGAWHHVAGFYDGGSIAIYIDGIWNNSRTASGSISTNTLSAYIGGNSSDSSKCFNGIIDSVRVYNTALSGVEIALLASGNDTPLHNPVGFWYMNTGSCTTTINAAPLKAAILHWPSGTKNRWSPAAGAFYKSMVRNP